MLNETHWALIEDVARELAVKPGTFQKWKERGSVPFRYRLPIWLEAERRGVHLPNEFIFSLGMA